MNKDASGFTLLETVIASGILVTAAVAIATMFVSSIRTNINNQDRTGAGLLLSDKVEQFSVMPLSDARWSAGAYSEFAEIAANGTTLISTTDSTLKYLRSWQISGTSPNTVTVVIYSNRSTMTGRQAELIRSTIIAAPRW